MSDRAKFVRILKDLVALPDEHATICWSHFQTLLRWNARINLTRITGVEEAARRHYAESVFLARQLPPDSKRIADLGSGAGFPGFPVALVQPDLEVLLIESDQRKAAFLRESTAELPNVRVRCVRSGEFTESVDWIVSRAVKAKDVLELTRRVARGLTILAASDGESMQASRVIPLPWDPSSVCLSLDVPRETP